MMYQNGTGARRLRELPEKEALRLLAGVPFGRIVFTRHALPAIRPVNHVVVDGAIVIRSSPGTILGSHVAPAEAVVAYEADELDGHERLGWSVIITGVARLVTEPGEAARLRAVLTPWVAGEMEQVIRIQPEIVTGFELVPAAVTA
ncbi:nitroimidazol reductase NimA-like FMN-containing flavoprotein (pyridoxamine 5'-phosphate oxidase superfamily) [Nonomuraea rubra]|uniref:Nitroimidazol reductase NimA-like FMN-containing flavoprotein (Pyridoxamine 5'-phosphate oxidase superfamily) n=2 Tax=Nonomuraea rubra TaxID=46180 RepID=A0A7X0TZ33_9ACTN|nr:nitroimidazol reductase NimA-like FMN-containing flavoprotein (pyridoxamine 5'-phosphate oxidase superfamily) [Nonomuraea rubra]